MRPVRQFEMCTMDMNTQQRHQGEGNNGVVHPLLFPLQNGGWVNFPIWILSPNQSCAARDESCMRHGASEYKSW